MRIVDEFTQEDLRLTVFKMNGRFSVKVEKGLLEQTFKFLDDQFDDYGKLKESLTNEFFHNCRSQFTKMELSRRSMLGPSTDIDNFPTII